VRPIRFNWPIGMAAVAAALVPALAAGLSTGRADGPATASQPAGTSQSRPIEREPSVAAAASLPDLRWHSPKETPFHVAGFGWFAQDKVYRRMPLEPPAALPSAVDGLAWSTAGGQIRFQTDSGRLVVRVRLAGLANMVHMPATGQCGFDCYIGPHGRLRYQATTTYDLKKQEYEVRLFTLPPGRMRNIVLNFPLYQGVQEVLVGLDPDARVLPPPPYDSLRRVVIYGTSITQGGCASRPGMAYTNILSRRFNLEFINLGFSGNGKGEPEVARAIATIEAPACFVLDYEANAGDVATLERTMPTFIRILREAHPDVPILVLSKIRYASETQDPKAADRRLACRDCQRGIVEEFRQGGDRLVFFHDGSDLLGEDWEECTVDGVHPTDLGFLRMANGLAPVLEKVLAGAPK
jgi:lysophospholipase L1-like esterase